jgi:hypothetical protein
MLQAWISVECPFTVIALNPGVAATWRKCLSEFFDQSYNPDQKLQALQV